MSTARAGQSTVRWGLLSTARINRCLIPAIRSSSRGRLVAVASRDVTRAQAYAATWEIPHAVGGYQELLDSGLVDAVYIGLPNHLHAEWSIRALQAGVHVLCEKPFATTIEDVDRMIAASERSGRVLAEAFMYRHHPQTKRAGEWVRRGSLGEIRIVRGAFHYLLNQPNNVRLVFEYGGGSLWDVGVYPLSFAQYVYGAPPSRVSGITQRGPTGVDLSFVGQMQYADGSLAQLSASFIAPQHTVMEICGSEGRLLIAQPFTGMDAESHLMFYPCVGRPERIAVPHMELYAGEVEDMHSAIVDGAPTYVSLQETRDHVRTTLALYESARSGAVVGV